MQYDYGSIMNMSYRFYDAERVGALPANYTIPWRGSAFLQERGPKAEGFGNMTGGFMTGGNAGTLKMTIPAAFTMTMLAWGMLEFPQVDTFSPLAILHAAHWQTIAPRLSC